MFKETQKAKQQSAAYNILLLVAVVLLVIIIQCLTSMINRSLQIKALEYIVYVFLVIGAAVFFSHKMVSYSYSIIDSDIIIEKAVGSRQRCVESINTDEILEMGRTLKGVYADAKSYRFSIKGSKKEAYYIVYSKNGKTYSAMMHPTAKFIEYAEKRLRIRDEENRQEALKGEQAGE